MDPRQLKPEDATRLLAAINRPETAKLTDYLQGRFLGPDASSIAYWTGPMLPPEADEYPEMVRALLKIGNGADNLIQSALETFIDSLEGLEDWRLLPPGTEQAPDAQSEEERALTAYLDRLNLSALTYHLALSLGAYGRTVARPVLSPRARDKDGSIKPAKDLAEALSRVHWQTQGWPHQSRMVTLENAGVILDEDTLEKFSVLNYQLTKEGRTVNGLEVSWIDPENNKTLVRIAEEGQEPREPQPLDLGGRLLLLEATLPRPFVTRSMLGAFEAYVVAGVMLNRNTHYAGYVERYAIGVQPPGEWVAADGTTSPVWTTNHTRFEPFPLSTGPGKMNFYQPGSAIETVTEPDGTRREIERPTPANIGRWEPVDPKAIQAALDHWRKAVRAEARQSFLELADSTDASGRAREVAAGDYLRAAEKLRSALTALLRDLLEMTLALAALQLRDGGRLRELRAVINSRVKAFPISEATRQVILQEWQANLIDAETALTESGRENAAPIMAKAQKEQAEAQARALEVAQAGAKTSPAEAANGGQNG